MPDLSPLSTPANQRATLSMEKAARLKGFEDQILEKSLTILSNSLAFADIAPDETEIPQEWIDEAGGDRKQAEAKFRLAKANWLTASEAPSGVKMAQQTALGIIKARAAEKAGPRILNVGVVNITEPIPTFPVIDVEVDDG